MLVTKSMLVFSVLVSGVISAPLQHAGPSVPRPLKWHQCPEKHESDLGLECTHIEVPIDWNKPNGKTFWLEMNRLPGKDQSARIGSAIYNPGGPGGSAIEDVICYANDCDVVEPKISKHFDLIGLDPRGVGRSSPSRCDPDLWNNYPSLYPSTEKEFDDLVAHSRAFSQSCVDRSGDLVGAIDTISVAKDVGAITLKMRSELELVRFAEWCESTSRCQLYGHDILKEWNQTVENAMETPIPAPECVSSGQFRQNVSWERFQYNFQGYLITKFPAKGYWSKDYTWYNIAEYLHQAFNGDATHFLSHVYHSEHCEAWSEITVSCLDYPHGSRNIHDVQYQIQLATSNAPYTRGVGESYNPSSQCLGWVDPTQNPPHRYNPDMVKKAPPILMVNSYYDPETPYLQAVAVQEQLPSAMLLTRDGDGHSSFNLGGQASHAMAQNLVNLTLPEANTVVPT